MALEAAIADHRFVDTLFFSAGASLTEHKIYSMSFAKIHLAYIAKAERKGRTKDEVDEILIWFTGYDQKSLESKLSENADVRTFFADAPQLNAARTLITGTICGVRIESIEDTLMKEIRYLDKLIDELAKGKAMDKILRKQ